LATVKFFFDIKKFLDNTDYMGVLANREHWSIFLLVSTTLLVCTPCFFWEFFDI